jgi:hypothetical protein
MMAYNRVKERVKEKESQDERESEEDGLNISER